jgi:hypothetical protein
MEEKRNKPDYAAIIREYRMYGGSGSMKRFCEENDYNSPNVNRYYRKHFWDRYSLPKTDGSPVRLEVVPDESMPDSGQPAIKSDQKIQRFSVRFDNGIFLKPYDRRNFIDSLIENHEGSMWFIEEFGKLCDECNLTGSLHQGSSGEVCRREYLKSNTFALLLRKSLLITKI